MQRERQEPRSGVHQLRITLEFEEPKSNWQVNLRSCPSAGQCWRTAEVWSPGPPAGPLVLKVLKDLRAVVASYNLNALGKHSPVRMWLISWCPVLAEGLQRARAHAQPTDYKAKGGQQMPSAHKECKARAVKTALTELRHLCSVDSAAVSITGKARPTVQQTPHWLIRAGSFHISKKTLQYFILLERMDIVSSAWPSPWVIFLLVCHSPSSICCAASSVFTLWCF